MTGLTSVAAVFGALMLASAAHSAARLLIGWRTPRSVDVGVDTHHVLMGISMAGMLVPGLGIVPAGPATAAWTAVWAVATAWFAVDVLRRLIGEGLASGHARHHLPHLAMSAAMLYMLAAPMKAMPSAGMSHGSGGMSGMSSGGPMVAWPTLDLVFLALMAAYAVLALEKASSPAAAALTARGAGRSRADPARPARTGHAAAAEGRGAFLAPRAASLADAAMGLTMAYMLAMMLA